MATATVVTATVATQAVAGGVIATAAVSIFTDTGSQLLPDSNIEGRPAALQEPCSPSVTGPDC